MSVRLRLTPICLMVLMVPLFSACQKETNYEKVIYNDGTEEIVKNPTIMSMVKDGKEVSILPEEWMMFYKDSKDLNNIQKYFLENTELTDPQSFTVRWTNENETSNYTFLIADNKKMENPVSYDINEKAIELKDLYAGTHYYYQIKAMYEDRTVISKRFDFKTADYMRTIKIDGVLNCRDLGNKKTNNGKQRVKQGLIYRTANFDSVTSIGKTQAIENYGIKTDLDLREPGPTESPLGSEVQYINNGVGEYGSPYYVSFDTGVNAAEYQGAMRDNLKVLTNRNNYPLAFHCAVGRDRTGTFAITLYLLLGIKVDQIKQDYAVSFFSKACNNPEIDPEAYIATMENLFKYYEHFKTNADSDKGNIYQRVENYCLHIGLSKDDIASIRNILLENI